MKMANKLKCIRCSKDEVVFQRQKIVSETKRAITIDSMYKCFNCGGGLSVRYYKVKQPENIKPLIGVVRIDQSGEIIYE